MQKDEYHIRKCLELIEESLGWGDSTSWGNHDFKNLRDKIFQKTKVSLSVSTLKRIWGKVTYTSSPTFNTLNALAQFLDYGDWRDFQVKWNVSGENTPVIRAALPERPGYATKRIRVFLGICVVLISVAGLGLMLIAGKEKSPGIFEFTAHKVTDDLPNSVVFDYEIPGGKAREVFIQQSWDPEKRKKVPATGRQHTSIYYRPGYFRAKLIVDGQIVKEDSIFIQTKGWKGILEIRPIPVYLSGHETSLPDGMGVDGSTLSQKLGVPVFNDTWVSFSNVKEYGILGSDFVFETRLKNTSAVEESLCRRVKIFILGKDGAIIIPLSAAGCIAGIDLGTGEAAIEGKDHDLSGFGCSYENFEAVKCEVKDHQIKIYHNEKLIHESLQHYSIGPIIGVRVAFEGSGVIQSLSMSKTGVPPAVEYFARK